MPLSDGARAIAGGPVPRTSHGARALRALSTATRPRRPVLPGLQGSASDRVPAQSWEGGVNNGTVTDINEEFNAGVTPTLFDEPPKDLDRGLEKLRALIGDEDPHDMIVFVHDGPPVSKARARWDGRRRGHYTPDKSNRAQSALATHFMVTVPDRPWGSNIAIAAIFFRPNHQRIDADNLMKLVMDAGTEAQVWEDDCQVTAQAAFIELDADRPRTIVALCPTRSTLNRARARKFKCQTCGIDFARDRFVTGHQFRRFCSVRCAQAAGLAETNCRRCGKRFRRTYASQAYCDSICANAPRAPRPPNANLKPWPQCADCGKRLSRRGYIRCSDCTPKGRPIGSKNKPKGTT
jgi:Holliday junction resolvase RusA-like endonuclease